MKKIFTLVMMCGVLFANAQDNPQITNGDFEDWSGVTSDNHAPNNWNSFETSIGKFSSTTKAQQVEQSSDVRPGSEGNSSVRIYARAIKLGAITLAVAQGNITTGFINSGSMTAANKDNHNVADIEKGACVKLGKLPKAIGFWAKYNPKDKNQEANFSATVHDNYNYITYGTVEVENGEADNASHAVAKARLNFKTEEENGAAAWKYYEVPLSTEGCTATSPDYIMVNFATSAVPGKGDAVDELFIDDVTLIYDEEVPTPQGKEYKDNLIVKIDDESLNQGEYTVVVTKQDDGNYTVSLRNFILDQGEGGSINVGTITIKDIEGKEEDGIIKLSTTQTIRIEAGDADGITEDDWFGPMLGDVPVTINAEMTEDKLYAKIDVPFKLGEDMTLDIHCFFGSQISTSINAVTPAKTAAAAVYNINGQQMNNTNNAGVYILRNADGTTKKVIKK